MSGRRMLIVYGSSHGQTAKIAERIGEVLRLEGCDSTVVDADAMPIRLDLGRYDAVLVGASIIRSGHQRSVRDFLRTHAQALRALPTGFFSVSGSAASADPAVRAEATRLMEEFLAEQQFEPELRATFGGAIAYTRYNPLLRWMMKRISEKEGGPTDTSRDHELTDWTAVERFARQAEALPTSPLAAHR